MLAKNLKFNKYCGKDLNRDVKLMREFMNKIINGFYYILKERKIPSLNRIKKFLGLGRKVIMPPQILHR